MAKSKKSGQEPANMDDILAEDPNSQFLIHGEAEIMRIEGEFRELREEAGIPLQVIADMTSIHPDTIKDFEAGAGPLTFREFILLLAAVDADFCIKRKRTASKRESKAK